MRLNGLVSATGTLRCILTTLESVRFRVKRSCRVTRGFFLGILLRGGKFCPMELYSGWRVTFRKPSLKLDIIIIRRMLVTVSVRVEGLKSASSTEINSRRLNDFFFLIDSV